MKFFQTINPSVTTALVVSLLAGLGSAEAHDHEADDPQALVREVVAAMGGRDALRARRDVEYTYTYTKEGKSDISTERYLFDGELSWGRYDTHENMAPDIAGPIIQGYDGESTWVTVDGELTDDEALIQSADFLRKTNFYWFAMMFKLLDPGLTYSHEGTWSHGGIDYDLVMVGFEEGVGDVQDQYLLCINPETHMVDRFLFTVMDFGMTDPLLMTVGYKEVDGVMIPATRRYTPAVSWQNPVPKPDPQWVDEISTDITFNNGFERSLFQAH